jgi:type II secretory pathway component PulF
MSNTDSFDVKFARFMVSHSGNERRRLWLKLAKMINNGVPIIKAIESLIERRVAMGQAKHQMTIALKTWSHRLANGATFSESISGWVSTDERMLIMGGEQSGELERSLAACARVMEAKSKIKGAVLGGTLYPAFLVLIAFGALALFSYQIVPAFTSAVQGREPWVGLARSLVDMSEFVQSYMLYMISALIAVVVLFFYSLSRWTQRLGGVRIKLDRYAPYSIYRIVQGSSWLLSFAAMIESGMRIEMALSELEKQASPWLKDRLRACLRGMRSGQNVGAALASSGYKFPDREIIDDMSVYASLAGFDEALKIIGNEWLEEGISAVQKQMKTVFAVGIIFVGAMLAFMIGGMFAMQIQLTDALRMM